MFPIPITIPSSYSFFCYMFTLTLQSMMLAWCGIYLSELSEVGTGFGNFDTRRVTRIIQFYQAQNLCKWSLSILEFRFNIFHPCFRSDIICNTISIYFLSWNLADCRSSYHISNNVLCCLGSPNITILSVYLGVIIFTVFPPPNSKYPRLVSELVFFPCPSVPCSGLKMSYSMY